MKNIVLTGFMASGKSTVGELLSKRLGYEFYDTDEIIEKEQQCRISEIFSKKGEEYFRTLENEISKTFKNISFSVISTGGGFVLNSENIENLRKKGIVFYLCCDDEVIRTRYENEKKTRPIMMSNTVEAILEKYQNRKPYYENCDVKIKIDVNKTPEEIADEIITKYNEMEGN